MLTIFDKDMRFEVLTVVIIKIMWSTKANGITSQKTITYWQGLAINYLYVNSLKIQYKINTNHLCLAPECDQMRGQCQHFLRASGNFVCSSQSCDVDPGSNHTDLVIQSHTKSELSSQMLLCRRISKVPITADIWTGR